MDFAKITSLSADDPDSVFLFNNATTMSFSNVVAFAQSIIQTDFANFTLGARFEKHSQYEAVFVPRFAITKVIDKFHAKLLVSRAYRAPSMENINFDALPGTIKPETTTVLEVEAGYQLSDNMWVTANFFNNSIVNPILYFNSNNLNGYINGSRVETMGFELDYRIRDRWGFLTLNYSFYNAIGERPDLYRVVGNENVLVGMAPHKIALNSSFEILPNLTVNPSAMWMSGLYGQIPDPNDELRHKEYDPKLLLNLFVRYENLFTEGLTLGLGINDIFNQKPVFVQPYNSWHLPLPGPSREIVLRIQYGLNIK